MRGNPQEGPVRGGLATPARPLATLTTPVSRRPDWRSGACPTPVRGQDRPGPGRVRVSGSRVRCQVRIGRARLAGRCAPSAPNSRQGFDMFGRSALCSGCSVRIWLGRLARHRALSLRTVDRRGRTQPGRALRLEPEPMPDTAAASLRPPENPRLLLPPSALDAVPNGMARGAGEQEGAGRARERGRGTRGR